MADAKPYFRIEWFGETGDFEGGNDSGIDGEKYTFQAAWAAYKRECKHNPQFTHRLVIVLDQTDSQEV